MTDFHTKLGHRWRDTAWVLTACRGTLEPLLLRGKGPVFRKLPMWAWQALKVWENCKNCRKKENTQSGFEPASAWESV